MQALAGRPRAEQEIDGIRRIARPEHPFTRGKRAELKPRITWDRQTDVVEGRRDARVVAVTSGGTIPDRGLYGVFMVGEAGKPGRRVITSTNRNFEGRQGRGALTHIMSPAMVAAAAVFGRITDVRRLSHD